MKNSDISQAATGISPSSWTKRSHFAQFHRKHVVFLLRINGMNVPLIGQAFYEKHPKWNEVIRIRLVDNPAGCPEIIIHEPNWRGRVIPDLHYGCEFCFIPDDDVE